MDFNRTISEHYKQCYTDTFDNLYHTQILLKTQLTKIDSKWDGQSERSYFLGKNFNELNTITDSTLFIQEMEFVIKNLFTMKTPGPDGFKWILWNS